MNIVLGLCLLVFSVQQVFALKCYDCLFGCNDPFSADDVSIDQTCSGSCMKTEKDGTAARSCLPFLQKSGCEELAGTNFCYCTEDLCNGASGRYLSHISVIVTIIYICMNIFKYVF